MIENKFTHTLSRRRPVQFLWAKPSERGYRIATQLVRRRNFDIEAPGSRSGSTPRTPQAIAMISIERSNLDAER